MLVGAIPQLLGGGALEIALTDSAVDATDLTTYTFSGRNIGVPGSINRQVVVGVSSNHASGGKTIDSVTIGGVTATQLALATSGDSAQTTHASLWSANIPNGTTATIVVTWTTAMTRCGIDVYRVANAKTTAYDTATDITITSNAESASISQIAGGAAIGLFATSSGTLRTTAWTNMTEQTDRELESQKAASSAMATASSTGAVTVTATANGAIDAAALAIVSFQPF